MFKFILYIQYGFSCEEEVFTSLTPLGWIYYRLKYKYALRRKNVHYCLKIGNLVIYRSK